MAPCWGVQRAGAEGKSHRSWGKQYTRGKELSVSQAGERGDVNIRFTKRWRGRMGRLQENLGTI